MNIKEYVDDKTIKLDKITVTVKFELILWDKRYMCTFEFDHTWDTVYTCGLQAMSKTSNALNRSNAELKLVYSLRHFSYDELLKKVGLTTLQTRRLRGDLVETYKILTKKERVDNSQFFQFADPSYNLRGHSMKLYKSNVRLNSRKVFNQRVIDAWNDFPQHVVDAPSVKASTRLRTGSTNSGTISADKVLLRRYHHTNTNQYMKRSTLAVKSERSRSRSNEKAMVLAVLKSRYWRIQPSSRMW